MTSNISKIFAPSKHIYLLSHSIGRMPLGTEQALSEKLYRRWQSDEVDIWDHWLAAIDDFRLSLSRLFNSPVNNFCPQSNISSGLSKIIHALPTASGRRVIVASEDDFPSAGFVLQQAEKLGYTLRILPKGADTQSLTTWEQVLDKDVIAVFITHVQYSNSKQAPVQKISEIARTLGILSIVDIAQSAGVVPIDLQLWDCDVVLGSCIKWLCGGPGAGFLWANPKSVQDLAPQDVGWFSHQQPFEFDINNFEYAQDSNRFWGGTPSVAPYIVASHSIDHIAEIGVSAIQAHNQMLIDDLTSAIKPKDLVSPSSGELRGGTAVIKVANREVVEERLQRAGVKYDARATGLRLSPHIYNTETEIGVVKECLKFAD